MAETLWKIPFGIHRDTDIEEVPDSYLNWLQGEQWFRDNFKSEAEIVKKELKYRNQFDLHIGWTK